MPPCPRPLPPSPCPRPLPSCQLALCPQPADSVWIDLPIQGQEPRRNTGRTWEGRSGWAACRCLFFLLAVAHHSSCCCSSFSLLSRLHDRLWNHPGAGGSENKKNHKSTLTGHPCASTLKRGGDSRQKRVGETRQGRVAERLRLQRAEVKTGRGCNELVWLRRHAANAPRRAERTATNATNATNAWLVSSNKWLRAAG